MANLAAAHAQKQLRRILIERSVDLPLKDGRAARPQRMAPLSVAWEWVGSTTAFGRGLKFVEGF